MATKKTKTKNRKKTPVKVKSTAKRTAIVRSQEPYLGILPLRDRVLVRPFTIEEVESKNAFGIIIPDTVQKEKPEQGEVVAVGEGGHENGEYVPMRVSVGDKVIFSKYGFDDVTVDGKEFYILKEENILAIIK